MIGKKVVEAQSLTSRTYKLNCKSLNGRNTLFYEVEERGLSSDFCIRIVENTGGGRPPVEGIDLLRIKKAAAGQIISSGRDLNKLMGFGNRNAGGFFLAILKDIGLVCKKTSAYLQPNDFKSMLENRLKKNKDKYEK